MFCVCNSLTPGDGFGPKPGHPGRQEASWRIKRLFTSSRLSVRCTDLRDDQLWLGLSVRKPIPSSKPLQANRSGSIQIVLLEAVALASSSEQSVHKINSSTILLFQTGQLRQLPAVGFWTSRPDANDHSKPAAVRADWVTKVPSPYQGRGETKSAAALDTCIVIVVEQATQFGFWALIIRLGVGFVPVCIAGQG